MAAAAAAAAAAIPGQALTFRRVILGDEKKRKKLGLEHYRAMHLSLRPTDLAALKSATNSAIAAYDAAEKQAQEELAAIHNVPDADGFIRVVKHGHRRNTNRAPDGSAGVVAADPVLDLEELKKNQQQKKKRSTGSQELGDFYRFQMREQKRSKLLELRDKFEEDKKKIESLRKSHRFQPY
ncbi:hypothetical protein RI367_001321 [Sorochytrium milnesiophthora]